MLRFGFVPGILAMGGVFVGVGGGALLFSETMVGMVRGATNPRGVARPRDHSKAEAFLARGDPEAAMAVLRASLEEFPQDAAALLLVARIRRDALADPEGSLREFRRARDSGVLSQPEMRVTIREMLDLARGLGEPVLVAPDLARHRDRFVGTEEGGWAAEELAEVKRSIER